MKLRLAARLVALFLGLVLLVQAAGFFLIRGSIERSARAQLAQELVVGERVWLRLLAQKAESLVQGATVLAADYGFRSAVGSGDTATLVSALENSAGRIGAALAAWVDTGGTLRAVHGGADATALAPLVPGLVKARTTVAMLGGRPHQFVAVPVRAPVVIGWVLMGFPFDQALADDMKALSGLEVVMPAGGVSTLAGAALVAEGEDAARAGEQLLVLRRVAPAEAGVLLLRSVDEALAPYRQLQWLLLLITLGAVGLFAVGSVLTARHVTTPLATLVRASERLGRGQYDEPPAHTGRGDEIGDLARAFDHMRLNIAAHETEIRRLAFWDRLTGLPNRAQFRDQLQRGIDAGAPLAVLMLDLDRFKAVNDHLGFAFGDRLLQAVAQRIAVQAVRDGDVVARISGDEFAILLPGADAARAQAVAARVAEVFEQPLKLDEQTVDVAAGFGIACHPQHAGDADVLLARAEVAMYAAKQRTERTLVYDPAIDAGSAQTLSLLSELRRALDQGELRLFLQPKVAVRSRALIGAEALVRWQHPTRGMVPPMQFIPFAEQTGFVRQLTLWIFEATAQAWPALARLGLMRVSVNLSTRDLMDVELPARLDAILARHGVAAQRFCLEITESAIMDDPQRAEGVLNALSAAGFKLSIDDFGTGYSSLAYLKRLPVQELKIDKSFVMGMATDDDDAKIVRSTIDLAHNLGLHVVAEGVEDAATLGRLAALQCDEAQGYHISRPVPAAELAAFAGRWRERCAEAALL